jgi:hypothetical protein
MLDKTCILRLLAVLIIAGFCVLHAEAQTTLYVSVSTGVDGPSCGTVGSPCTSLHGALTVLGSDPGSIVIAAGTYTGANNTNLNIAVSNVSIVTIGLVTFSGGGSVRGWTLSGNNVLIENIVFSNFKPIGSFESTCRDVPKLSAVLRIWWRNRDEQRFVSLFELHFHEQRCHRCAVLWYFKSDGRFLTLVQAMVVLCMSAVVLRAFWTAPSQATTQVRLCRVDIDGLVLILE